MGYDEIRDVEVWDGQVRTQVLVGGQGPPLLYLHPVLGLQWDPFLDSLARHHTVYAPYLPGTVPGDPDAHKAIEDVWDLTLCYYEILDALGIGGEPVAVVGHSLGGMMAAALAASEPERVSKLILLCPIGLWVDGRPFQIFKRSIRRNINRRLATHSTIRTAISNTRFGRRRDEMQHG